MQFTLRMKDQLGSIFAATPDHISPLRKMLVVSRPWRGSELKS
jgi:hypothetical protein